MAGALLRTASWTRFLGSARGLVTKRWSVSGMLYSSKASQSLLKCVQEELKLEQKTLKALPSVTGYTTTVAGSQAILQCTKGNEKVKVELDANNAIEVSDIDEADDESEPFFVPAFTVTVTKPSGNSLQFECSFEEYGDYQEQGNEYKSMCLDSVTVIPANTQEAETIYSAPSNNLSEELYGRLMDYLKDNGINEQFVREILEFYKAFEHTCHVEQFLKGLQHVVQN